MDDILGQSRAVDTLRAAAGAGKVHHAFIFEGPSGVGKFTTAAAFARLLLCHQPATTLTGEVEACGGCESCRLMRPRGEGEIDHPDLHVIRKELAGTSSNATLRSRKQMNIPIDLLREFMVGGESGDGKFHESPAYKTAALRHGKVFVIDEAELLDARGQNTLLKTLEEPPAGTYIILVTSQADKLLITIRSRCQRVSFGPLPDEVVGQWIDQHHADVDAEERAWLISFAAGSLGRIELARDYDLHAWARQVLPGIDAMAKGQFDAELGQTMAGLVDEFAQAWVKNHANASKDAANRMGAGLMWSMIAGHARQRLSAMAARCEVGDLAGGEDATAPWLGVIDAIREAEMNLASNVNAGLVADHLAAKMMGSLGERHVGT